MAESEGSSPLRASVSVASEKIQEIVDTAERVADEIQTEARVEAERYAETQRREVDQEVEARVQQLQELAGPLVKRVEDVRRLTDELVAELTDAVQEVRGLRGDATGAAEPVAPAPASESPMPPGPRPVAYPGRDAPSQDLRSSLTGGTAVPEDALLRATQLAVAGSNRDQIEEVLRAEFDLDDPGAVADGILGAEGA